MLNRKYAYLIINADDYGYYRCISRGITECVQNGIVTATGIMPTSPNIASVAEWIARENGVDFGVHLTLTNTLPLSRAMKRNASKWKGQLPGKYTVARAVITRQLKRADVKTEWRMQIEKCLDMGAKLHFLNSHEHIHMLPPLFSITEELGSEYDIPYIRVTKSELPIRFMPGPVMRDLSMAMLSLINQNRSKHSDCDFIGLSTSGNLSMEYLARKIPTLKRGHVYELMCHPGYYDPAEIQDSHLRSYHYWENELQVLTGVEVRSMFRKYGAKVIGYRDLDNAQAD
jgi:predicted glycoside hydrolase/deacetylase ChbG (UPF0249 family)